MTFFDGPNLLTTVPVGADGSATYTTSFSATGAHTITAAYSGNANCDASNNTTTVQVTTAPTPPSPVIEIDPNPVAADGKLKVGADHLICKHGTESATAWSDGFKGGSIELTRRQGSWGGRGDGHDRDSLVGYGRATGRPGWYDVKLTCDGQSDPSVAGSVHVVPEGAHTGDGSSILAASASDTHKASGLALLGGSLGLGAFAVRRKLKAHR